MASYIEKENKQATYSFTKTDFIEKPLRGAIPIFDPPSNYDDGGPKIGLKRWKKVGYKFNPLMDEVEQPQVMLVNRRLQNICEIVNISNFRLTLKELNQANEISFTVYKELNNEEQPFYERISDLGVVYVNGEYFEIGITNQEDASIKKNVVGVSLGYAELSQIITSVQINTDDDLDRPELTKITKDNERYKGGTIFYNPVQAGDTDETREWRRLTSMLDRVLEQAPHYKIGTVDETLRCMQRTFSWEDTDILSILNNIGQEIGCVFDIVVERGLNGEAIRTVNAYDLCYCKYCWNKVKGLNEEWETSGDAYRNIENGVCLNCKDTVDTMDGHKRTGGEDIVDIGQNTGIFLSTENLTDDITVDGNKDEIKTAFKVVGGDDYMTDTLQGLNPSGTDKIMLFPQYIMKNFSPDLYRNYKLYREANEAAEKPYGDLLEIIYHLRDIQNYLKSGKMPVFDEPIVDAEVAFNNIAIDINNNFSNIYYLDKKNNYTASSTYGVQSSISKLMKVFMPKGFGVKVEAKTVDLSNYTFNGSITVYSTSNKDDTLTMTRNNGTISATYGEDNKQYVGTYLPMLTSFIQSIAFRFGDSDDTSYAEYISRYCASLLSKNDVEYENDKEKDWSLYSYERLKNWRDGYQACIDTLSGMYQSAETSKAKEIVEDIIEKYAGIRDCIQIQMDIIENQLYAIGQFLGEWDALFLDSENKKINYTYKVSSLLGRFGDKFKDDASTLSSIADTSSQPVSIMGKNSRTSGTVVASYNASGNIGNYPFKCKKCGSTNVRRLKNDKVHCINCTNDVVNDFITYKGVMDEVIQFYNSFDSFITNLSVTLGNIVGNVSDMKDRLLANGKTLYGLRQSIQEILDIKASANKPFFLDDNQFGELMSYVREQVYSNTNYISEGLPDDEVFEKAIELHNKAKRELSKACMPQYNITASVGSIIALEPYEFLGATYNENLANFAINNYVHVRMDDDIYKLRVASIELTYPMSDKISVSFTNAERYENGFSSDIASILANAQSMATSFDAVATQSEKGVVANDLFNKIKQQGLDTSLMAVNGGRNQDVVIDDHGILLRELNEYTGLYDPHQTKMVSNNFVMTSDNWKSARLAIGLTLNPAWTEAKERHNDQTMKQLEQADMKYLYGVYADAIVADLIVSERMRRIGNGHGDDCTVELNDKGIEIFKGLIDINDGTGNRAIINPCGLQPSNTNMSSEGSRVSKDYIHYVSVANPKDYVTGVDGGTCVFYINRNGDAYFGGEIRAKKGYIGEWTISPKGLYNAANSDAAIYTGGHTSLDSGERGFYISKDGLSIGNKFKVTEDGTLTAYNGLFDGTIQAHGGYIDGTLHVTGTILGDDDGVFRGKVEASKGNIGGWLISGNSLISSGEFGTKICTSNHLELDPKGGEGGFYIGEDGFSVGNFFIETTGASQGMMTMPKCRVAPFIDTANNKQTAGNIQFLGSEKAKTYGVVSKPGLNFGANGADKGHVDTLYLMYGLRGKEENSSSNLGGVLHKLYNCLEVRNRWKDGTTDTFDKLDNKYLGKIRVSDVIIGQRSLRAILGTLGSKHGIDSYGEDLDEWWEITK